MQPRMLQAGRSSSLPHSHLSPWPPTEWAFQGHRGGETEAGVALAFCLFICLSFCDPGTPPAPARQVNIGGCPLLCPCPWPSLNSGSLMFVVPWIKPLSLPSASAC